MIKKYLEFIEPLNESYDLILESDVVYSDKFRKTLKKLSDRSELAKKLMDIENKDLPVRSNFFDTISDTNDKLSFIPDSKAQEILKDVEDKVKYVGPYGWLKHSSANNKIFNNIGYKYEEGSTPYSPSSDDIGWAMNRTISTKGYTYVLVKWINETGEELGEGVYNNNKLIPYDERIKEVWSKSRQDVKIGKALRALLKSADISFLDKELEELVNELKSEIGILNNKFSYFDIVKGSDIAHWYKYQNYSLQSGTLGSSCMKDVEEYYFDIYVKNTDVCQLVILKSQKNDEEITARALLWKLNDGNYFMDRVYTIDDSDLNLFREYAKQNGWYSKYYNNSTDDVKAISPSGESNISLLGEISINKGLYRGYPYMDTFKYFSPNIGELSVDRGDYELERTDGELEEDECEYCYGVGEYDCSTCDAIGEYDCDDCDASGEYDCDECDGSGREPAFNKFGSTANIISFGPIPGGLINEENCKKCDGSGKLECTSCEGDGNISCSDCGGDGTHICYNC